MIGGDTKIVNWISDSWVITSNGVTLVKVYSFGRDPILAVTFDPVTKTPTVYFMANKGLQVPFFKVGSLNFLVRFCSSYSLVRN